MSAPPIAIPVLTDVIAAQGLTPAQQTAVLAELPGIVQATVASLRPQFEQQLLDALLPRVAELLHQVGAER